MSKSRVISVGEGLTLWCLRRRRWVADLDPASGRYRVRPELGMVAILVCAAGFWLAGAAGLAWLLRDEPLGWAGCLLLAALSGLPAGCLLYRACLVRLTFDAQSVSLRDPFRGVTVVPWTDVLDTRYSGLGFRLLLVTRTTTVGIPLFAHGLGTLAESASGRLPPGLHWHLAECLRLDTSTRSTWADTLPR